ncbi:AraC family transcriptional regulator [Flagellimonas sp. DF-77]|uniref:helix-turn-helix domain-containing protein n=1 Tax=Flagellimonas algarum TaxID=3230298 RepID=UPI003393E20B
MAKNVITAILNITVYRKKDWVFLLGSMENNQLHKHYTIQVSIPVTGTLALNNGKTERQLDKAVFIKPNVTHRLESSGNNLHLFFNPQSRIGMYLNSIIGEHDFFFNQDLVADLIGYAQQTIEGKMTLGTLAQHIERHFEASTDFKTFEKRTDDRLLEVLDFLYTHRNRWVKAEECAQHIHLSKSRFLHFFKETTGSTFRRSQLWIRICESIGMLKEQGISETAFHYGFYDNAHYGRAFKENLGFTPKAFVDSAVLYNRGDD